MANPLVAGPVDTTSPLSGTGLLDDGAQLASAIRSGNWVEGGLAAFSTAVDTVAAASDPLGSLIAAGLGWLIDHFEPLKGWFDDLTGDPGEVAGFAQTWNNIAQSLTGSGNELTRILGDVEDQHGAAMDAYRSFQQDAAHHIHGAAEWAGAMGKGLSIASQIVQLVHDLLRDVLSQLVGSAISWASEEFFSFGLATPWVIEQVTTRVSSLVEKVSTKLTAMLRSVKELSRLLDELKLLLSKAHTLLDGVLHGGSRSTETIADETAAVTRAAPGEPLSPAELKQMADDGYHSTIFSDKVVQFYDTDGARLGRQNSDVWAMPTEDAAGIHSAADAARQTGRAPMVEDAWLHDGEIYSAHFPVDPSELRRPTVADSGGYEHFYSDPTNPSTTYGHTAVNTGTGAYLVNPTRETLVAGGDAMPAGSVLTRLHDGQWVVVRRY